MFGVFRVLGVSLVWRMCMVCVRGAGLRSRPSTVLWACPRMGTGPSHCQGQCKTRQPANGPCSSPSACSPYVCRKPLNRRSSGGGGCGDVRVLSDTFCDPRQSRCLFSPIQTIPQDPIILGDYPDVVKVSAGPLLPQFTEEERVLLKGEGILR